MNLPQNKKILIVQAHPDDADFYCGGTVAKLSELKNEVLYLICTDGGCGTLDKNLKPEKLAKIRKGEQVEANKLLQVKKSIFLDYPDLSLKKYESELQRVLARHYRKIRPDILITFDPYYSYEFHPDHTTCGFCALYARLTAKMANALKKSRYEKHNVKEIWLFKTSKANLIVDIARYKKLKLSALMCHKTQFDSLVVGLPKLKEMVKKINYDKKTKKWVEKFKRIFIEGALYSIILI